MLALFRDYFIAVVGLGKLLLKNLYLVKNVKKNDFIEYS